jgi:inositol oxygenase
MSSSEVLSENLTYDGSRDRSSFRNYEKLNRPAVRDFYHENHVKQTYDYVLAQKNKWLSLDRCQMGIWEALEYLNTLIDDSDPDTDLSQIQHCLQTAEQLREDGQPRWMILTGLIHDLGKILCLWGEPQWAVVGDTFPVGCPHDDRIVFSKFFAENPDSSDARFTSHGKLGVYSEGCGLEQVHMSWGHDEYLYHVVKNFLPDPALYCIRFHSFYPWHRDSGYDYLCNDKDREMLQWVRKFNPYDLYTKGKPKVDVAEVKPFYDELIAEFFPAKINW